MRTAVHVSVCVVMCAGPATADSGLHGPEWEEPCDAGNLPGDAQPVTGPAGPVQFIEGRLEPCADSGGDFQDMFLIRIGSPSSFLVTVLAEGTDFDPELWLFDATTAPGLGRLANDDDVAGGPLSVLPRMANDGSGVEIVADGLYYLAISGHDSNPESDLGEIFDQVVRTEVSGNDGIGGMATISGWDGPGETGAYRLMLTGVDFIVCPGDVNGDGFVTFEDLLLILSEWGPCAGCAEDIDGNDVVDFADLLIVLSTWGRCE